VRWLPTSLYYLGYFKNCILIATFLGFGIGCATRVRLERLLPYFPFATALVALCVCLAERHIGVEPFASGEFLWPQQLLGGPRASLHAYLIVAFLGSALVMIPLGRAVGVALLRLPPLRAYSLNLLASLAGVLAFILASLLELGPIHWFAIALLPLAALSGASRRRLAASLLGTSLTLGVLALFSQAADEWSPYSKITLLAPIPAIGARVLLTNNNGHQVMFDLSPRNLARRPEHGPPPWGIVDDHLAIYDSAYALVSPRRVLVVGGGTGNETAAALRHGVERVDVVEIDPVILRLGRRHHPERPYSDPRVRAFVADGRQYVGTTRERYDLVVFGFLDSTSRLSSFANIRLDNYVYTREAFAEAARLLTDEGLLQVTYYAAQGFMADKLSGLFEVGFGAPPLAYELEHGRSRDVILFGGPALASLSPLRLPGLRPRAPGLAPGAAELPTDDWPFMALESPGLSRDYQLALLAMLACALALVVPFVRGAPRGAGSLARAAVFFLQGAAFMLLEAVTILRMALLFGSTWIVVSLTLAAVLLSGLLSVELVRRLAWLRAGHGLALLGAGVVLNFWILETSGAGEGRAWLAAPALFAPVLGSSLLFSRLFQSSVQSARELGFNLLGAVAGGLLEYASLVVGAARVYLMVLGLALLMTALLRRVEPPAPGAVG
jgi:SAM-dependent methyltransferase